MRAACSIRVCFRVAIGTASRCSTASLEHDAIIRRPALRQTQSANSFLAKLARCFQNSAHMKTTTLPLRNLMNRSPLRTFLLILFVLASFALSPTARAVDPPPDGGYPGDNTAEGTDALFSLTGGTENTALGADALYYNAGGTGNTAVGHSTLLSNTSGNDNTAIGVLALFSNTLDSNITAIADFAIYCNTSGDDNTADGSSTTPPVQGTRRPVMVRFMATQPARQTRPMVLTRSLKTQLAVTTRPTVLTRSCTSPSGAATSPWVPQPVPTLGRETRIST